MMSIIRKKIKSMFPNLISYQKLIKYKKDITPSVRKVQALKQEEYPLYIKEFYEKRTHHCLDLEEPKRLTEKIQWRKIYDRDPVYSQLSDKYRVREWVEKKIGKEYLIPLLGSWEHFNDINFDLLPNKFVLKTNNGCHTNYIVKDKKKFLHEKWSAKKIFEYWLKALEFWKGLELHYLDIKPLIIAEEYLLPNSNMTDLVDYKFHCLNGTPLICEVIEGRTSHETIDFYDMDWNHIQLERPPYPRTKEINKKPCHYEDMVSIARKLSQGFKYVRVDLFDNGRVYFGEMTFTPASGLVKFNPDEWDYQMGELWDIHDKQVDHSVVGL